MLDLSQADPRDLPRLCRQIVTTFIQNKKIPQPQNLPPLLQKPKACFVSLYSKKTNLLRGCIGTFIPQYKTLWEELAHNALAAAFSDPRFPPLQKEELNNIRFSVDLLGKLRRAKRSELDPQNLGLLIRTPDGRTGLLLPRLAGIDTAEQQINICCQKGSIDPKEEYQLYVFKAQRLKE